MHSRKPKGWLTKKRLCRICKGPMPPTRYFNCVSCVPALPSEDVFAERAGSQQGAQVSRLVSGHNSDMRRGSR